MKLFEITEGMYSIDQSIRDAFKLPDNQKYNRIADIVYKVTGQKVSPRDIAEEIHHSGIDDFIDWVTDFDKATYDYKPIYAENFADGKKPGRKGLAKRSGVNTKASVSSLRKTAKNSTGEKQRMAHWMANMKAGKKKKNK